MFSKDVTTSDAFREMPTSTQALYFHLGMEADDDGFLDNYKGLMRAVGSSEDDLKILLGKRFLLPRGSGILVVKHWLINSTVRKDRYQPTRHIEAKNGLFLKENRSYTDNPDSGIPLGNHLATQKRIGEDRKEEYAEQSSEVKVYNEDEHTQPERKKKTTSDMVAVFELFDDQPQRKVWKLREIERVSAQTLHDEFGIDELKKRYGIVKKYRGETSCPQIDKPSEFLEKMPKMEYFLKNL